MAKFYGDVGYVITEEAAAGVWEENITRRKYYGDILKNTGQWVNGMSINDNIKISNTISIIADPFAFDYFHAIRFVEWLGVLWSVTSVDVQRPRLVLYLGEKYNA